MSEKNGVRDCNTVGPLRLLNMNGTLALRAETQLSPGNEVNGFDLPCCERHL
jgi:hypothetical protein